MSIDKFASDPELVKAVTNIESDGVGRNEGPQIIGSGNPAPYYEVSVKDKPGSASDNTITHTGPGAGVMGGIGDSTDVQGFVSATGNKVVIDNTFGSDTITLQHHSGATIMIDADGSIHMISSGSKGVGIVAPKGDMTMFAKGHMILKGDGKITIETVGDLDINVGGSLNISVGGDMVTTVHDGSIEEVIQNGSKIIEVAKDSSTMIAGDYRITSAGKMRIQTPQSLEVDAGKEITVRSDKTVEVNAQKNVGIYAKEKIEIDAKDDIGIATEADLSVRANGTTKISSTSAASIHSSSTIDLLASAKVNIKGSTTDIQTGGSPSVDDANINAAQLAQYPTTNTIIDSITSVRLAPDFPKNAAGMSAEEFSLYKNEGGRPNPQAEAYAAGNKGSGVTYQAKDSGITAEAIATGIYDRPAGVSSNNGTAEKNPLPIPTSIYNSSQKISKHITVGQIINIRSAPAAQHQQILKEAMNVAWNILDPLYEKFGGRMYISSWYRDNSSNHIKGGAVDIRCSNKPDYGFTAEMAAYVRDFLPYSKILLEKNDQGGIHCHVESAQPGQQGGGSVLTCADPHCQSAIAGIKLSYAVAALEGRVA
jgi:uncharacterized protein (DUF2345 family)